MAAPDDCSLTNGQYQKVRAAAEKALAQADARGTFPTPVDDVVSAAKLVVADEGLQNLGLLAKLRKAAGDTLKRALEKVLGVFDTRSRVIFLDTSLPEVKQRFLKLHETGHGSLEWQRDVYSAIEECSKTLSPEISELFDREANVFASEVLFQLDTFTDQAKDVEFGIKAPLALGKRYGASAYATLRRYVARNARACAVIVLEPPNKKLVSAVRRVVASDDFLQRFSNIRWPDRVEPTDTLGLLVPTLPQRMSRPKTFMLLDANGTRHEFVGEGFATPHHTFLLVYPQRALTSHRVFLPPSLTTRTS